MLEARQAIECHATGVLAAQLDVFENELEAVTEQLRTDAEELQERLGDMMMRDKDLPIVLQMREAQMEVPEARVLPNMAHAVLLKRNLVECLNSAIRSKAGAGLARLRICSDVRRKIFMVEWELQRQELARLHKLDHIKELQLVHLTRNIQEVLDNPDELSKFLPDKQLESQLLHNKAIHVRHQSRASLLTCYYNS